MGCTSSKLDDLPAVVLCRDRCSFLDEAIHRRYALAEAHSAYLHSLKALGFCLHRFFDRNPDNAAAGPPSPVLNLPPNRKGDSDPSGSPAPVSAAVRLSHSNSGSHLEFNSDSEDEDSGSESESLHHHLDNTTVMHPYNQFSYSDHETLGSFPGGYITKMNYMKKQTTPSVVYEQRPMSSETVHRAEFYSSSIHSYPYSDQNPSSFYNHYSNYSAFFGNSSTQSQPPASASSSNQPPLPPPPPPPSASGWEFLNPFENYEQFYPPYTPSRNSKEVREEEGIPELENEDHRPEIVKEVHEEGKSVDGSSSVGSSHHSKRIVDDVDEKASDSRRPSVSMEDPAVEYKVPMVDKNVVEEKKEKSRDEVDVATFKSFRNDGEVVKEIQIQFERASESGNELAKILEVGKLPYNRKHAAYQGSTKMLNVSGPFSVVSSVEMAESDPAYSDIDIDFGVGSKNQSSTLKKLYFWEKKLYQEVKVEEKMRVLHERKCRKLKKLDEKGAEAHKVDATRILVRSLSTKIRIAIQVVDKISIKINKLRDEELWPQLNEFIQGLSKMWKSMLECHQSQCHAISQAKKLDTIASRKHLTDADIEATLQLEKELINWTLSFSCWVTAQKDYVRALNDWLLKCLLYEPEETPDGIAPFSPGRVGAPPVFVACNQWSQALETISEKEVLDTMRDFATNVFQLWERDKLETGQRKIQKEILALDKMMVGNSNSETGGVVYQSDTSINKSLQLSMQCIFEAMERFTARSLRSYEELLQSIEEDRHAQERAGVS